MTGPGGGGGSGARGDAGTVVVVGGGLMGSGIAHAFLLAGRRVRLVEVDEVAAAGSREAIRSHLEATARRGRLEEGVDAALSRLEVRSAEAGFGAGHDVSLAIEAVPEVASLKLEVLAALEAAAGDDAVVASNTSSIAIGELAAGLARPGRFLGLHFFNPVPASLLVEVVVGADTSAATVERAGAVVEAIGKRAIVVKDSPGFATSRLGVLLGLEAIRMLEDEVASAEDIDLAMTLGYKHPVGPLHLTDLVGLDVRLAVADYLRTVLGERYEPPALLREKVARGELGRKCGRGFFTYPEP